MVTNMKKILIIITIFSTWLFAFDVKTLNIENDRFIVFSYSDIEEIQHISRIQSLYKEGNAFYFSIIRKNNDTNSRMKINRHHYMKLRKFLLKKN
jgi:predicted RND superfamily exporter protein